MLPITSFYSFRKFMAAAVLAAAAVTSAHATTITFDDGLITAGSVLSTQYASLGVTFAPGGGTITGVVNPASTTQGFAPNTSMLVGLPGSTTAAPIAGNVLHTTSGWLSETGDAVFTMTFTQPISLLSVDFGANASTQGVLFAVDPTTGIAVLVGSTLATVANSTVTAVGLPTGTTTVVVVPGNYGDYVAVDNITFTAVPEPSTVAASLVGLAGLGLVVRRQRRATV